MATAVDSVYSELAAVVGPSGFVTDPQARAAAAVDGKQPECVVFPSSAEQVAQALKCAADADLGVIPFRNGTKLSVGNPPRRYDMALSLKDMNRVWHYEPDDLTITVEVGIKFGDLERLAGRRGLWLPLDAAGGRRASLGGILATGVAGPLRLRYGAPRDMTLGVKVATTEGKIIKSGGRVVKNVAGYDLTKLLIGSYGTLGVIVEASFKLFPLPAERATFVFEVRSLDVARELREKILHSPVQPLRQVLLDARAANFAAARTPDAERPESEMWIEVGGTSRTLERCRREIEAVGRDVTAAVGRLEREMAETGWARIVDLRSEMAALHPDTVVLKATLPVSASEELLVAVTLWAENASAKLAAFVESGVGVLHLCFWSDGARLDAPALIGELRHVAVSLGGALVVERCPDEVKTAVDAWGAPGSDFEVMRKLKQTWDPNGTLSPGRFVGGL